MALARALRGQGNQARLIGTSHFLGHGDWLTTGIGFSQRGQFTVRCLLRLLRERRTFVPSHWTLTGEGTDVRGAPGSGHRELEEAVSGEPRAQRGRAMGSGGRTESVGSAPPGSPTSKLLMGRYIPMCYDARISPG